MPSLDDILKEIEKRKQAQVMRVRARPVTQTEKDFINNMEQVDGELQRAVDLQAAVGAVPPGVSTPKNLLDIPGATAGQNVILVNDGSFASKVVVDIRGEDALAEGYTITLTTPITVPGTGANLPNEQLIPVAVLQYGSGGVQGQCEVDWGYGQSFTLPGSAIRVLAKLANPSDIGAGFVVPAVPAQVSVGAFASKGFRKRDSILYRSKNLGTIPHGNNQIMYIPACATQVRIQWQPSTVTNVVLRVIDASNVALHTMYEQNLGTNPAPLTLGGFSAGQTAAMLFGQQQSSIIQVLNNDGAVDIASAWAIFTIEP